MISRAPRPSGALEPYPEIRVEGRNLRFARHAEQHGGGTSGDVRGVPCIV